MPIQIKYELTLALSYDFYKSFLRQHRQLRLALIIVGLVLLLALFIGVSNPDFSREALLGWLLPLGMILVIWVVLLPRLAKHMLRRSLQESKMGTERLIILSEEDIVLKTQASDAAIKWEAILKTGESQMSYFLYMASNQALIIPKSCLSAENEVEFLDLLHHKGLTQTRSSFAK